MTTPGSPVEVAERALVPLCPSVSLVPGGWHDILEARLWRVLFWETTRSMPSRAGGLLLEADHVYAEIHEVEGVTALGR
jgi:hypothetical protein